MGKILVDENRLRELLADQVVRCDGCLFENTCKSDSGERSCIQVHMDWLLNTTKRYRFYVEVSKQLEYEVEASSIDAAFDKIREIVEPEYGGPDASYDIEDWEVVDEDEEG